ncbi:hypothetical protein [Achromobacter animicus]|uniref:hypothetical protein n=1 Tax=Achromobacter animicus TaxID=1389935 RepID=UPI001581E4EB|nr:hypothetical protein [Achromobacter animicus]
MPNLSNSRCAAVHRYDLLMELRQFVDELNGTDNWYGPVAPAGTPKPVLERLNAAFFAA